MLPLLALICGILFISTLPLLPAFSGWAVFVSSLFLLCHFASRPYLYRCRLIGYFLLACCWGVYSGQQLLANQLAPALENAEIFVEGHIVDLPEQRGINQRFLFQIDKAQFPSTQANNSQAKNAGTESQKVKAPERVLLTWYFNQKDSYPPMEVGQRWQFLVKLKRPRALVNEGGFDYQRWLLSQNIGATGYIRQSALNKKIEPVSNYPVQQFRFRIKQWLSKAASGDSYGPLLALAIGDNSEITQAQWQLFRATGTGHLMAISGLHIGLVAVFGLFLGRLLCTILAVLDRQWRFLSFVPGLMSCGFALAYSALAGFGLPTQRALVMVVLLNLALIFKRGHQPLRALALAALIVLLIDPLAGWDMGFWLSFGAVAVLLIYFLYRQGSFAFTKNGITTKLLSKPLLFVRAQGVVFIGLMLPLLMFNTPFSLLAPLANLIVIPVVSFLVVIPLLLGVLIQTVNQGLANILVNFAASILQQCFSYLQSLQDAPIQLQWFPEGGVTHWAVVCSVVIGMIVLLQAKGFPGRWLGWLLLIPALFPAAAKPPPLSVTVLDVGQGLAVLVQTPSHTVLYDTGAKFSDNFNIGEAVLLPYLRQQGIVRLDAMIISHGDNDHAGGAEAIMAALPIDRLIVGEHKPEFSNKAELCQSNQQWRWDEVEFRLIEPALNVHVRDNNNLSCILLVSYKNQHLLLPGDIEASVEKALIADQQLPSPIAVLLAPHHGSRTSSTQQFIQAIKPQTAIFSAAFGSRYGHPHPKVTKRYQDSGADLYNTASAGQIKLIWQESGGIKVEARRETHPRYWFSSPTKTL